MELKDRIKASTPRWFKKIRRGGIYLSSVALALLAASTTVPGFVLPDVLNSFCQWVAVGGIVASAVSTTAKEDHHV